MRSTGTYVISTSLGEAVQAFVPHTLPPAKPVLAPESFLDANRVAELALARLSGVAGLVPSVDWLLYSAIRKEALLTSQIEGTQADEHGVSNCLRTGAWRHSARDQPKTCSGLGGLVRKRPNIRAEARPQLEQIRILIERAKKRDAALLLATEALTRYLIQE